MRVMDQAIEIFIREIYSTPRKQVLRLIISEGPRFPALAEFYYREVLSRMLGAIRARLARAFDSGEIADDTLIRFPQMLGAVAVMAVIWSGLFERFEPLDVRRLMRAYFDRLLAADGEGVMNMRLPMIFAALVGLTFVLVACNERREGWQGWIEANLIFVAPDEVGRVQTLSVREGDVVKAGDPLFTVDDDLQRADLAQIKASLTNAQQTYDRATMLLKSGAGTQKDFDAAEMVLRDAQARLNSAKTRLSRRSRVQPG